MERLTRQRDRAIRQISNIVAFANNISDVTILETIEVHLFHLIDHHKSFSKVEEELEQFDDYIPVTKKIDDDYYQARAIMEKAIKTLRPVTNPDKTEDLNETLEHFVSQQKTFYESINSSSVTKLPKINIEPFSGDYKMWPSFKDLFESTIHDHPHLKGAQKLQQLKSLLRGEAAALVRHITTTDQNYDEAWTKLIRRYEKPKPIVATLIQSFLDQKGCAVANYKELRQLCDCSDEIIRALRSIGPEVETRDPWLIHLLLGKVDDDTKQLWARTSVENQHPTFQMFMEFLDNRCDALESCIIQSKKSIPYKNAKSFLSEMQVPSVKFSCYECNGAHLLYKCPLFKNKNLPARYATVKDNLLCHNCLRKGHIASNCTFKTSCLICQRKHHTLLHSHQQTATHAAVVEQQLHHTFEIDELINEATPPQNHPTSSTGETSLKSYTTTLTANEYHDLQSTLTHTLLPTAIIQVQSRSGEMKLARVLLDSGSQCTFVTESLVQNLSLSRSRSRIKVYGLAGSSAGYTRGKTTLSIQSRINNGYVITITAQIVKTISQNLPEHIIHLPTTDKVREIELADPYFHQPRPIDILIGIDHFFNFIEHEQLVIPGFPPLQKSVLGWLAAGTMKSDDHIQCHTRTIQGNLNIDNEDISESLKRFWVIEEPPSNATLPMSASDAYCEELYNTTTTRNENGRWMVRLPLKEQRPRLGNSYTNAKVRLLAMERKFSKDVTYYQQYREFMNDYIQTGHMIPVQQSDLPHNEDQSFYLPHHGVYKLSSSTTRLRVVFDASCRSSSSVSLNDILYTGPKLQSDLFDIMLKFRRHQIAFVADIEKMYRQILIHPDDRFYQLILWRETPNDEIQIYQLQTVTYGLACSPYLAIKTLQKIAYEHTNISPIAAKVIGQEFYIDDLLSGANTEEEAMKLKGQIVHALQQSGFQLRKWRSNSQQLLKTFSTSEIEITPKLLEVNENAKTLGVTWKSNNDTFSFTVVLRSKLDNWTKRQILSEISKIYDPLGWISPTVMLFKILIQRLWVLELDWDSDLPQNINSEFNSIYNQLTHLNKIEIPRSYHKFSDAKLQLHAFCDASEKAYGCVIYIRATNLQGAITTNIVCAKGKVAPIKQISVPRMELCGAYLLAKVVQHITNELFSDNQLEVIAWCDSTVVLKWLSDIPRRWKSFIANRTAYILDIVPRHHWRYVPTKCNPADLITKGINPQSLGQSTLWFKGPSWLQEEEEHWPTVSVRSTKIDEFVLERRSNVFTCLPDTSSSLIDKLLDACSSYFKLKKCMVYVLRFGKMLPNTKQLVTIEELAHAERMIIRLIQHQHFHKELEGIRLMTGIHQRSKLLSLDPFLDKDGILRVGGRLRNSQLKYSAQFPIVLPKNHAVNKLIINEIHHKLLHGGVQIVLNTIRQMFWIIDARRSIKQFIHKCIVCIRHRATNHTPKMGDLPVERVTQYRPFLNCGLDYAGPIQIKTSKLRNAPYSKAYIALFICMSTKAAHLELVSSLDTEAFIAALRRFIARRGYPSHIWCDNGSNFVGANAELKRLRHQLIQQQTNNDFFNFCLQASVQFHFNPPSAPHFGGLWEATVKSVKFHLRRVTEASNFTFEEMSTMLVQIEAILNSRPLCRLYDNIDDLQVLTPGHLLIGEPLIAIPEPNLKDIPDKKLNIYQNIQKRVQGFWDRWHRDYLCTLNQRTKWRKDAPTIRINDIVLIKDTNLPPNKWALGRVLEVYPGKDGIIRVVKMKTSSNELLRPVTKLINLPVATAPDSDVSTNTTQLNSNNDVINTHITK